MTKPKGCGFRITPELYEKLVDAYRPTPGMHLNAARITGISRETCKRGWDKGWHWPWAAPIRQRIAQEQAAARHRLHEMEQEVMKTRAKDVANKVNSMTQPWFDKAKATSDAVQTRAEEAQMARGARRATIGLTSTVSKLIKGSAKLADRIQGKLENEKTGDLGVEAGIRLIKEVGGLTKAWTESMKVAMELERLYLGNPDDHLDDKDEEEMDVEEAVRDIVAAQQAAQRQLSTRLVKQEVLTATAPPPAAQEADPEPEDIEVDPDINDEPLQ